MESGVGYAEIVDSTVPHKELWIGTKCTYATNYLDDVNFTITDGALDYIVEKAIEYKLGARGLRSLCEEILTEAMFDLPGSGETKLNVTKAYAEDRLNKSTLKKLKAVS